MKKIRRIIRYLLLSIVTLLIVLTIVAKLTENAITDFVAGKISQSIAAPIIIDDASFTLIRRFPLSTIEFNGLSLGAPFLAADSVQSTVLGDTLASIGQLFVSVRSKELFSKKLEIVKIEINEVKVKYLVDTAGISNFDFLLDTTPAVEDTIEPTPLNLALNQLILKNITGVYIDEKLKASAHIKIQETKISGIINGDNYNANIKGDLLLSDCAFQETPLNKMQSTELKIDLNYQHDTVFINELDVSAEGAELKVIGNVLLKDKFPGDLKIEGKNFNLYKFEKYIPGDMLDSIGVSQLQGTLNLSVAVQGELADTILPQVSANFNLNKGVVKYLDYPLIKNISVRGNATNGFLKNNKTTQANIKNLHFETAKSAGDFSVSVQNLDQLKYKANCKLNLDVDEFNKFIPDTLLESVNGQVIFNLKTEGELPATIDSSFANYILANTICNINAIGINIVQSPDLRIDSFSCAINYHSHNISVENLKMKIPNYHLTIEEGSLTANYSGDIFVADSLNINLESLNITTPQSSFRATASVNNLNKPSYKLSTHLGVSLQEWLPNMPDSLINDMKGNIQLDVSSNGALDIDSIAKQIIPIVFTKSFVAVTLDDVSLNMPDSLMNISGLSGNISLSEGEVNVDKLKGEYMKVPWGIDSTVVENLYAAYFLHTSDTIKIDTRINLGDISYAVFAPLFISDSTTESSNADTVIKDSEKQNFKYIVKGKLHINSLTYEKALLSNISAKYKLTNNSYKVDQLIFEGFDGRMNSSLWYFIDKNNLGTVYMQNNISGMNIKNLLSDFDNFDQTNLTHKNISGLLTSELHSQIKLDGSTFLIDDFRLKGNFIVENGGLYDYEPLRELPKITSLDELEKIEFKTFETDVFVNESVIYIPKTYISSTAFDIGAFGMQKLNNDYEYHLQFHPKDFLMEKSKNLLKEQAKLGDDAGEDQRNTVKLLSEKKNGKAGIPRFDNKESQKDMNRLIKTQRTILKLKFYKGVINYNTGVQ